MKFNSSLSTSKLTCSEVTVLDYKQILKCSYGDNPNLEVFCETICEIIGKLTNKPIDFIKNLPISDVLCILIDVRLNSMGNIVTLSLKNDQKQVSLDLNLAIVREDIAQFYTPFCENKIDQKNVEVVLSIPSIEMLSTKTEDEYLYFIKRVSLKNNNFEICNTKDASAFFENTSAKAASQIILYYENFIKSVRDLNLLSRYKGVEQKFGCVPTIENLLWFVKLLFNEPLDVFYDNIFYLAKHANITPTYIDHCTPGEYIYFVKKLEASFASQKQQNQQQTNVDYGSDSFPEDLQDANGDDDGYVDL